MGRIVLWAVLMGFVLPFSSDAQNACIVEPAHKKVTIAGYTRSKTTIILSSEVSGKVLQVNYEVGDTTGEKAFCVVDTTFIDFKISDMEHQIKNLIIRKKRAASRVGYLEKEFNRIDTLHKGDRATEVKLDETKEALQQARFDLDETEIRIETAKIGLKELKERKNRHFVHAPKDWILVDKLVEEGEVVGEGVPLARIANFQELVVPLFVSNDELAGIRAMGKTISGTLEGEEIAAVVHYINPEFNEKTRKLSMELLIRDYHGDQRGGLRYSMDIGIRSEGYLVPFECVVSQYENPRVELLETGEKINVIVVGETGDNLVIAEDDRIPPGTRLRMQEGQKN